MSKENTALPWKVVTKEGYGKLDLILQVGPPFGTLLIVRQRPKDENEGAFVVFHNEGRVSERYHSTRAEAIAEAERYFYDNPLFGGSANAAMIAAVIEQGRQAYRAGLNLYQNPFTGLQSVERANWAEGWLQAYTLPTVTKVLEQATRLNSELIVTNEVLKRGIAFALDIADADKDDDTPYKAIMFLREWATSNDPDGFNAKYPEWPAFRDDIQVDKPDAIADTAEPETPTVN